MKTVVLECSRWSVKEPCEGLLCLRKGGQQAGRYKSNDAKTKIEAEQEYLSYALGGIGQRGKNLSTKKEVFEAFGGEEASSGIQVGLSGYRA